MEIRKENKMGTMAVNRLLVTMSLPMMVSMLVQALYNIVDSIFVSWFSDKALTAVSLTFPVQALMIAFAAGTGVGINSILSRKLGEKNFAMANKIAENGLFLGVASAVLFAILGAVFSGSFFGLFTDDAETIQMGQTYMFICTVFSLGIFMQIVTEKLFQSTGKTVISMVIQICGAVINLILDPILIFGLFGLPKMGIAGAAIATVAGQWISMTIGLILNATRNKEIQLSWKSFRPERGVIAEIYKIGVPSIVMQAIISVMVVGMNRILQNDAAISVFGIYYKLQSFVFMPIFGMTNALIPIAAYNFGARSKARINAATRISMIITTVIMAVGTLVFWSFPGIFLDIFKATPEIVKIGIPALRIISISFVLSGISIVLSSLFQALGRAYISMIVSILRQLAVILPAALILKHTLGLGAVWYAMPLAEIVGITLCVCMYFPLYRKVIKPLSNI